MNIPRCSAAQMVLVSAALFIHGFRAEAAGQNRDELPKWCGPSLHLDNSVVTLTGTIVRETEWGPPGFGEHPETDSRFTAWILELDFRLPVAAAKVPQRFALPKEITRLQVRGGPAGNQRYDQFLNRHVSVAGTVSPWLAPSDVTPIVIHATQVRFSGPPRCDGAEAPPKI